MQNKRTSYLLLSLFISNVLFILYIVNIYNPGTSFISDFIIDRQITESNFKFTFLMPLIAIPFLHINFTKKHINEYSLYLYIALSLAFLLAPASFLSRLLPKFLVLIIYFIAYYALIVSLFSYSAWLFSKKMEKDQFNLKNQTFPQTEKKIETPYSVNIPYKYYYNDSMRKGWVNIVNVFSSIWVYGVMGSGKTYTWFLQSIYQLMNKGFSMAVYDFKYPNLTRDVHKMHSKINPRTNFYYLYLNDIRYSNKCNPLEPKYIPTIQDIEVLSRIIIRGTMEDDGRFDPFFDGSAQGILTGLIAILKKWQYKYGVEICSLPHAILLASVRIDFILPILLSEKDILMQVTSLREAFLKDDAAAQLAGQTASLSNRLRGLYSDEIMYIMSGKSDFDLELNSYTDPKILCIGSEQKKAVATAPIISVFFEIIARQTNVEQKEKVPFMMFLDEFARLNFPSLSEFLSTGRSNQCGVMGGTQGIPQIEEKFKQGPAKAIIDIQGTVIAGQCGNETAKYMAEKLGKTNQQKTSITETMDSYSVNHSTERDYLVPASRFATMGVGEFAGVVVDDFHNVVEQKRFMGKMEVDKNLGEALKGDVEMPIINSFDNENTKETYQIRKAEIEAENIIKELFEIIEELETFNLPKITDPTLLFYIKYLRFDQAELRKLRDSIKIKSEEITLNNLSEAVFERLKFIVEDNEVKTFLENYLNKLYSEIEYYVKLEYKNISGIEVEEDLFNVTNKMDYIIFEEEIF